MRRPMVTMLTKYTMARVATIPHNSCIMGRCQVNAKTAANRATLNISNRNTNPELPSMRMKLPLSEVSTVKIPAMRRSENMGMDVSHLSPNRMRMNGRDAKDSPSKVGNVIKAVSFIDLR